MVSNLCRESASKSEQEQKKAFADMLLSSVMHIDCTNAKVNGKNAYVFVCAAPGGETIYFAREHKGHEGVKGTPAEASRFESRYLEILEKAGEEYKDVSANEYYTEGYNLFVRLKEYMSSHLLFLHDCRVPPTNNEAERLLRSYKRKQQQAVSFRSFESIETLC